MSSRHSIVYPSQPPLLRITSQTAARFQFGRQLQTRHVLKAHCSSWPHEIKIIIFLCDIKTPLAFPSKSLLYLDLLRPCHWVLPNPIPSVPIRRGIIPKQDSCRCRRVQRGSPEQGGLHPHHAGSPGRRGSGEGHAGGGGTLWLWGCQRQS